MFNVSLFKICLNICILFSLSGATFAALGFFLGGGGGRGLSSLKLIKYEELN